MLNYVSPDARLRGVSKAILGHLEAEAYRLGISECSLESTKTAQGFYQSFGYVASEGVGQDNGKMTKPLNR